MEKEPVQRETSKGRNRHYKGSKPILTVSESKKTANNFSHTKDIVDYYISCTTFRESDATGREARDLYMLYDIYNNVFPDEFFHYVKNPLNSKREEHKNFPARLRPYNIIRPNIDLLLGEFDKRPKNYTVVVSDAEASTLMEQKLYEAVLNNVQAHFVQQIQQQSSGQQGQQEQLEPPARIKDKFLSNYKDERAIWAQVSLEQLDNELLVDEVLARSFKDYVIAGEAYTYKGIEHDMPVYERVSPIDIDYDKGPDTEYIEDASWVVRRQFLPASDIVTMFYDELKKTDIDNLEDQDAALPFSSTYFNRLFGN